LGVENVSSGKSSLKALDSENRVSTSAIQKYKQVL
jgi:hypothetical protein